MEKRREKMSILRDETGAVAIVEATFVFPIMFFVLFFIMMMGNIYYQQARIDDIVSRYAIIGADKMLPQQNLHKVHDFYNLTLPDFFLPPEHFP